MDVKATKAKIWRKDIPMKNGDTFPKYSVSVSRKMQDGKFVNAYIPVVFAKRTDVGEISNGATCDFVGFVSVESYTDREGNIRNSPQIVITKVEFEDPAEGVDSFESAEDETPF